MLLVAINTLDNLQKLDQTVFIAYLHAVLATCAGAAASSAVSIVHFSFPPLQTYEFYYIQPVVSLKFKSCSYLAIFFEFAILSVKIWLHVSILGF